MKILHTGKVKRAKKRGSSPINKQKLQLKRKVKRARKRSSRNTNIIDVSDTW